MKINFSPIRSDSVVTASVSGSSIAINGDEFNFSALNDGDVLPHGAIDSKWFAGPVRNVGGEIELTLLMPHGPNPAKHVAFPESVTVVSGAVEFPQ